MTASPQSPADDRDVMAGQAVYSPRVLAMYDWLVLGFSNRLIWRCRTHHLEKLYRDHLSNNHLDVGVGTGYFLDRVPFPAASPRIVLMDLNETCLSTAAARIARYQPQQRVRNILDPIPAESPPFDSIGLNYVLHCLPGTMTQKAIVFDHLRALLNPGGVIFGSTLLSAGVSRNLVARQLMSAYNRKGIFSNQDDSLASLQQALQERFESFHIDTVGCVALFSGR